MNSAQREAHARMLATLPIREHIRMAEVKPKKGRSFALCQAAGRKGKRAAMKVPVFRRMK